MNNERIALSLGPASGHRPVTMRGPADMAELLPYLLGFFPDDSIVAVGLQGPDLHQGGVIRLDIPESPEEWQAAAEETAALLIGLSERRDRRPAQVLLYLCQDPGTSHGPPVLDGLRPLAEGLRVSFESRGVAVKESLCVSAGRWWSFLCRREGCCDPAGNPIRRSPDPGPVAAAATVAGFAPRGSRKAIIAGLVPIGPPGADTQSSAIARVKGGGGVVGSRPPLSRERGAELLDQAVAEFSAGARELDEHRTALLIIALQDRITRDRAAEYTRPEEIAPAQRLWRFLARHCVPPYTSCAAAPLTLLAWTSWVAGDIATARVVLAHTLRLAPSYLLAQLLYESLNEGMSPDALLASVAAERQRRTAVRSGGAAGEAVVSGPAADEPGGPPTGPDGEPAPAPARSPRRAASGAVAESVAPAVPGSGDHPAGPPNPGPRAAPVAGDPGRSEGGPSDPGPGACLPAQARRIPGCRPRPRPGAVRKARLGRVTPWAAPATAATVRSRCRGVRGPTAGARHAR
ncbi:DUF4192 family protein [Kitasatospora sp. NPDC087315]|uniref:DUF4192 family protein n=1 Tax=Kitasatospora sp. NPDC087315 TaxID=3364069 RepID=UPI0038191505